MFITDSHEDVTKRCSSISEGGAEELQPVPHVAAEVVCQAAGLAEGAHAEEDEDGRCVGSAPFSGRSWPLPFAAPGEGLLCLGLLLSARQRQPRPCSFTHLTVPTSLRVFNPVVLVYLIQETNISSD